MECVIRLPDRWVDAAQLENTLRRCGDPHDARFTGVAVHFPPKCKLIIDASIRLLSLLNQLQLCTKAVSLHFLGGDEGVMGYLDRIGFFDHLHLDIVVHPHRPLLSGAIIHRGGNRGLVEIARINRLGCDEALPGRLAKAVEANCAGRADVKELGGAIFTIFAELVGNIFEHSNTQLDGYAALQTYTKGDKLSVAVSDSGLGIMETLRPTLPTQLRQLKDVQLLVEIFREGLSRHGGDRGNGLKGSAAKAIKYKAELDVRLPNQRVLLIPSPDGYRSNTAWCEDQLPLMWGTHIAFHLKLT